MQGGEKKPAKKTEVDSSSSRGSSGRGSDGTSETELNSHEDSFDGYVAYNDVGRCLATGMTDSFGPVAYKAQTIEELVTGLEEFVEDMTCLPPGTWDAGIRVEPQSIEKPAEGADRDRRKSRKQSTALDDIREIAQVNKERADSGLVRSGRLFGGLINDIKRKLPW